MGFIEKGLAEFARTSGASEIVSALLPDDIRTDYTDSTLIREIMTGAVDALDAGADVEFTLTIDTWT